MYDGPRFNGLPRGYEWIRKDLTSKKVGVAELVRVPLQYGDKGTIRRMGMLLEREGVSAALLRKLERALKPSSSLIPWIPGYPKRGTVNRRWGVVVNDKA